MPKLSKTSDPAWLLVKACLMCVRAAAGAGFYELELGARARFGASACLSFDLA